MLGMVNQNIVCSIPKAVIAALDCHLVPFVKIACMRYFNYNITHKIA